MPRSSSKINIVKEKIGNLLFLNKQLEIALNGYHQWSKTAKYRGL